MHVNRILVPTDFSDTANHAEAQAIALATRHGAQLRLFHVVEPYWAPPPHMTDAVRDYLDTLVREANTRLASTVDALRGAGVDASYATAQAMPPNDAIVNAVETYAPDMVVIGTHGRRGLQRFILGSVAEKVLRTVPVNVLSLNVNAPLVGADRSYARVLVPIDFSAYSRRALDVAFDLLADDGVLHVVHVLHAPVYPAFYPGGFAAAPFLPPTTDLVEEHLTRWLGERHAVRDVRLGDPLHEILEARNETDAELIVMGTRGLTGLEHVMMGSVSERVVRRSPVAVLTVH